MTVLITGGAGYIGSHACVEFVQAGYDVVVLDNFCNSSPVALQRVEQILGQSVKLVEGDIRDRGLVEATIRKYGITSVVHFAGLKAVRESSQDPLEYYNTNVVGSEHLLSAMRATNVYKIIFSSSATVYGENTDLPFTEDHPLQVTNPYGRTKLMVEDLLRDLAQSDQRWTIGILRYFNPIGAHQSGLIGENSRGIPANLVPYLMQVASGHRKKLHVYGGDYETADGTGVRDYIHVLDLVKGHIKALAALDEGTGCFAVNLGTGRGYSVLEIINAFERATNRTIPFELVHRRPGDVASSYANTDYAKKRLDWEPKFGLYEMCRDSWNWFSKNPHGYSPDTILQHTLPGIDISSKPKHSPRIHARRAQDCR